MVHTEEAVDRIGNRIDVDGGLVTGHHAVGTTRVYVEQTFRSNSAVVRGYYQRRQGINLEAEHEFMLVLIFVRTDLSGGFKYWTLGITCNERS